MIEHWEFDNLICGIASEVGDRYPQATKADLRQEIYVNFYETTFQQELENGVSEGRETAFVRKMAYRVATKLGKREKAHRAGYEPEDNQGYPPGVVRELLPDLFLWIDRHELPQAEAGQGRSMEPANERGLRQVMMCDLAAGFEQLPADAAELLVAVYDPQPIDGAYPTPSQMFELLASERGVQPDSVRRQHNRYVTELARIMSGVRSDRKFLAGGGRGVVSNRVAQHITRLDY